MSFFEKQRKGMATKINESIVATITGKLTKTIPLVLYIALLKQLYGYF